MQLIVLQYTIQYKVKMIKNNYLKNTRRYKTNKIYCNHCMFFFFYCFSPSTEVLGAYLKELNIIEW